MSSKAIEVPLGDRYTGFDAEVRRHIASVMEPGVVRLAEGFVQRFGERARTEMVWKVVAAYMLVRKGGVMRRIDNRRLVEFVVAVTDGRENPVMYFGEYRTSKSKNGKRYVYLKRIAIMRSGGYEVMERIVRSVRREFRRWFRSDEGRYLIAVAMSLMNPANRRDVEALRRFAPTVGAFRDVLRRAIGLQREHRFVKVSRLFISVAYDRGDRRRRLARALISALDTLCAEGVLEDFLFNYAPERLIEKIDRRAGLWRRIQRLREELCFDKPSRVLKALGVRRVFEKLYFGFPIVLPWVRRFKKALPALLKAWANDDYDVFDACRRILRVVTWRRYARRRDTDSVAFAIIDDIERVARYCWSADWECQFEPVYIAGVEYGDLKAMRMAAFGAAEMAGYYHIINDLWFEGADADYDEREYEQNEELDTEQRMFYEDLEKMVRELGEEGGESDENDEGYGEDDDDDDEPPYGGDDDEGYPPDDEDRPIIVIEDKGKRRVIM